MARFAVAHCSDDEHAAPYGVLDRTPRAASSSPRRGRPGSAGGEAQVDDARAPSTAQRIARASASGEIVPSARTTLATSSRDGNATPAMPVPLLSAAAITPATKVPWPTVSLRGRRVDEALGSRDAVLELGVGAVDARVDDRDLHRLERGRPQRPVVEGADGRQVPLLPGEGVVDREGDPARPPQALDVGDSRQAFQRRRLRRVHDERERDQGPGLLACGREDPGSDGVGVRAPVQADGEARAERRRGNRQCARRNESDDEQAPHAGSTVSCLLTPTPSPPPAGTIAR